VASNFRFKKLVGKTGKKSGCKIEGIFWCLGVGAQASCRRREVAAKLKPPSFSGSVRDRDEFGNLGKWEKYMYVVHGGFPLRTSGKSGLFSLFP
jgi:hypothetical protein